MSLDKMITATVKCTVCGAGYGRCDCWSKCDCGWSYRKGESCRRCKGDDTLEVVAMTPRRKRAQEKMIRCKGCRGHGHYIVPADVGGTRSDKKKICGDCKGTGYKLDQRAQRKAEPR